MYHQMSTYILVSLPQHVRSITPYVDAANASVVYHKKTGVSFPDTESKQTWLLTVDYFCFEKGDSHVYLTIPELFSVVRWVKHCPVSQKELWQNDELITGTFCSTNKNSPC